MKRWIVTIMLLGAALYASAQTPAFQKNKQLGRGINLGNMFEASSESAWGNPFRDEYIEQISNLGFRHVRIPICWEADGRSQSEPPYTLSPEFIGRIRHVVDLAQEHHLSVIINMHHHKALMNDPGGQRERFLSMWRQLAESFSGCPDELLFELLNEPHGNVTAEVWNNLLADGVRVIRKTDASRIILVGTAEYGGLHGLTKLELPADDRIILTLHYYNPFSFTHQGAGWVGGKAKDWLGTRWAGTEEERLAIQMDFAPAIEFSRKHNIPIHIGEFGAFNKADLESRARWTGYLAGYFARQGFSWAYWEFNAGFGIYDTKSNTYVEALTNALLGTAVSGEQAGGQSKRWIRPIR